MSVPALKFVAPIQVNAREKLVLWVLANRMGDEGQYFAKRDELQEHTCLSEASIRRALAGLEKCGLIVRIPQRGPGGRQGTSIIELVGFSSRSKLCFPADQFCSFQPIKSERHI